MKVEILFPDAGGHIDGPVWNLIVKHLQPQQSGDVVVVPCVWHPGFTFNEQLRNCRKPLILIDMLEFGWDYGTKENRLGHGTEQWPQHLKSAEWDKLDAWVRDQPPALTLKRELWQRDYKPGVIYPIDFPCAIPLPPVQSETEFNARPLEVFFVWGLSNPARPRLHGDIFAQAHGRGYDFLDSWELLEKLDVSNQIGSGNSRKWATIYTPHYHRAPMSQVMKWQQRSKISVSMPGAGRKCFRSSEAAIGSALALLEDDMAWSYPWINDVNCIRMFYGGFESLMGYSIFSEERHVYEIYVACQETAEKYQTNAYARDYLMPLIESVL